METSSNQCWVCRITDRICGKTNWICRIPGFVFPISIVATQNEVCFALLHFRHSTGSVVKQFKGTSNCLAEFEKTLKLPLKFF